MKVEIFEKARQLGEEIAACEEYRRLKRAQAEYDADIEMRENLSRVEALNEEIDISTDDFIALRQLEELRAEVAELKAKIASSRTFLELKEANGGFTSLMEDVNQVIGFVISGEAADAYHGSRFHAQGSQQVH